MLTSGIKTAGRNINNLRYTDDTTIMAESKEELKSLLMNVKEQSERAVLKLNIQKTKIMASSPVRSDQISRSVVSDSLRPHESQHVSGWSSQRAYSPVLFLCKGLEHLQIFRLKEAPGTNPLWLPKDAHSGLCKKDPREIPRTFCHMRAQWGDNGSDPGSWLSPDTGFASTSLLPGESQGRGSLVGCHLWGRTESDMTEAT